MVGSREGFVVSLLLLLLRMSRASLQDGPENVEIQCQLPPRFDALLLCPFACPEL